MPILVEAGNNPLREFSMNALCHLAKPSNVYPPRFKRVRKNLVRSADVHGPLAAGVVMELPNNYFSAVWRRLTTA